MTYSVTIALGNRTNYFDGRYAQAFKITAKSGPNDRERYYEIALEARDDSGVTIGTAVTSGNTLTAGDSDTYTKHAMLDGEPVLYEPDRSYTIFAIMIVKNTGLILASTEFILAKFNKLAYGDLALNALNIFNLEDRSAGVKVEIRNTSTSNQGSGIVRVEIRAPGGLTVDAIEDTTASWNVAPSLYSQLFNFAGLEASTNYTAHLTVFDGTTLLLGASPKSFTTLGEPAPPSGSWFYGDLRASIAVTNITQDGADITVTASHNNSRTTSGPIAIVIQVLDPAGVTQYSDSAVKQIGPTGSVSMTWLTTIFNPNTAYTVKAFAMTSDMTEAISAVATTTFKTLAVPGPGPGAGISAGMIIAAGGLAYVLFTKSGKKMLRKVGIR